MIDNDLDWLIDERPRPISLDHGVTRQARQALMDHVAAGRPRRRPAPGRLTPRRLITTALASAIAGIVAVAVVLAISSSTAVTPGTAVAPHRAQAAVPRGSLVQLANFIRADRRPAGNATLVLRTQRYPHQATMTGADLYTDSGKYFYATTESGLPSAIAQDANQGGFTKRELAVASFAANGNLKTARQRMAVAALAPGYRAQSASAAREMVAREMRTELATMTNPRLRASVKGKLEAMLHARPISDSAQMANRIWENSLDTLVAGAANPLVRAGVLRLLSTMDEVTVKRTRTDGQPSITITASAPALPAHYDEQLTINARTGLPIRFVGGTPGRVPGVTVTYRVSRVTVAAIAAGH
jgi:hypothetical protein